MPPDRGGKGRRAAPFLMALSLLASLGVTARAEPPVLRLPVACTPGVDCYIQQYVDRDPGPGARDFACGTLANDGHMGTDIALPSLAAMRAGVPVVAAAPGEVRRLRDGMPDIDATDPLAPDLTDRECGNGVAIRHGQGWETQYCHLRAGSVRVREGQQVEAGTPLGLVGMSGLATFPHVHFSVRKGRNVIDPFLPDMALPCAPAPESTLWEPPIGYTPGGLAAIGVLDRIPDYEEVKAGLPANGLPPGPPAALVIWGYVFNGTAGDVVDITLAGPDGEASRETLHLEKSQPLLYRAWGKRAPRAGFASGRWTGEVALVRDGVVIDRRALAFTLP